MMNVVIVGQSSAIPSLIKTIREKDPAAGIKLLCTEATLPVDRSLFPRFLSRKAKDKDLLVQPEDFYKSLSVEILQDKVISRVNPSRKKIFLADKTTLDYEVLVLSDAPAVKPPAVKGHKRQGVFHLGRAESLKSLVRYLPYMETVIVEPSSVFGIEAAVSLKGHGKDVLVVSKTDRLISAAADEETSALVSRLLEKKGVRVLLNTEIEDILGENEVKAARLKSGKVIACESVVFEDVSPDLKFIEGSDLLINAATGRIPVTSAFRTNVDSVYAFDVLAELESPRIIGSYLMSREVLEQQAAAVASALFGEPGPVSLEIPPARRLLESVFSISELAEASAAAPAAAQVPAEEPAGQ